MFVDSHCHLDLVDAELGGVNQLLASAAERDIHHFLCVCVGLANADTVRELAEQYDNVFASAGVHPNEVANTEISAEHLLALAAADAVVAVGETGLDYYRSDNAEQQRDQLAIHVGVARELKKPLIIHMRDAAADTLAVLDRERASEIGGVMHCYVEDIDSAKRAIDMGFMISFSGIVTFRSAADLQQVARQIPVESLLVETDSPWLAPVPWRGKTNQPAYVRDVAEFVAELRDMSVQELAEVTTDNFFRLFSLARR
ncbi:MAG: DNAase [Gammaproteobacteria bacterium]|nr:MAG: DNAase [Gammaproteobacteria bacterium]RLA10900.1 MAG: DNAase [Gammaproteobacteria bacterium]